MSAAATAAKSVAIINDDPSDRKNWSLLIGDAGYDPVLIEPSNNRPFTAVNELADLVELRARWAICDHRLSLKHLAQFTGAQATAALNSRRRTPTLLITTFEKQDADVSIRQYREHVPVLLSADEFDPETIGSYFEACATEILDGNIPDHRRAWRTLVQIEDIADVSGSKVLDVLVPSWSTTTKVRFPAALIKSEWRERAKPGMRFIAAVNTGAKREEDLFFKDFEVAPEPNPHDGLA